MAYLKSIVVHLVASKINIVISLSEKPPENYEVAL